MKIDIFNTQKQYQLIYADPIFYKEIGRGRKIITERGDVFMGVPTPSASEAIGVGYIPHKQTCPNYKGKGGSL